MHYDVDFLETNISANMSSVLVTSMIDGEFAEMTTSSIGLVTYWRLVMR